MVFLTGHGSTATQALNGQINKICTAIANRDIIVAAVDGGGTATFGNDTAIARISDAVTWMRGLGVVGKILASGYSMGGSDAMNWGARNLNDYAGFLGFSPAVDLDYGFANNFTAELNAAYGGNFAANHAGHDPLDDLVEELSTEPWHAYYATDDTVLPPASTEAIATAVGGTLIGLTGGHVNFFLGVNPEECADRAARILDRS